MSARRSNILAIRNLLHGRCKAAVEKVMGQIGLPILRLELGEVELMRTPTGVELEREVNII